MPSLEKPIANLDMYFKSEIFRDRLDAIRLKQHDNDTLKVIAFSIVQIFKLKNDHTNVIYRYLRDGFYDTTVKRSKLRITKASEIRSKPLEIDIDENAVFIEVSEDLTKEDLIALVSDPENWRRIRDALNDSYPGRIRRFAQTYSINRYLDATQRVLNAPSSKEKEKLIATIAAEHGKEIPEIRSIVRTYAPFFKD